MLYYVAWGITSYKDNAAKDIRNIVQLLFRRGLQENSRNECIQSGHTTFDYIHFFGKY